MRSEHPDGDGLMPQAMLGDMRWVSSAAHPCVRVADVAAWVLRRALAKPGERETVEMFEILKPLLEGEHGVTFQLFSVPPPRDDQLAMYSHPSTRRAAAVVADARPCWELSSGRLEPRMSHVGASASGAVGSISAWPST